MIGFDGVVPRRRWPFEADGEIFHVQVDPVLYSDDAEAAVSYAQAGLGIVCALRYHIIDALKEGSLIEVLVAFQPSPVPMQAVLPSTRFVAPVIRKLIDAFVEAKDLWSE